MAGCVALLAGCTGGARLVDAGPGDPGDGREGADAGRDAGTAGDGGTQDGGYCDACAIAGGFCINGHHRDYLFQACKCTSGAVECGYYPLPAEPCRGGGYCNAGQLSCTATPDAGCTRTCDCVALSAQGAGHWGCRDTCGPGTCPPTAPSGPCALPAPGCGFGDGYGETFCTCAEQADAGQFWDCAMDLCGPTRLCPEGRTCKATKVLSDNFGTRVCERRCACKQGKYECVLECAPLNSCPLSAMPTGACPPGMASCAYESNAGGTRHCECPGAQPSWICN